MAKNLKILSTSHPARRQKSSSNARHFVIRGAPDDRGVLNVGGRVGAAQGPAAVRRALGTMGEGLDSGIRSLGIDFGDDSLLGTSIADGHDALRKSVVADLKSSRFPIVIGGGHDYGLPHIGALSDIYGAKSIALINIDAHLDVRESTKDHITSGSPYYLALEQQCLLGSNFVEFGIQPHCNTPDRLAYLKKHKAKVLMLNDCRERKGVLSNFRRELQRLVKKNFKIAISVDLDAIASAFAPGVSAPQADGFSPSELFSILELCSSSKNVVSLGFFELAPALDRDDATAKLCATAIHRFCSARFTK